MEIRAEEGSRVGRETTQGVAIVEGCCKEKNRNKKEGTKIKRPVEQMQRKKEKVEGNGAT